jgi:hypothetical protein
MLSALKAFSDRNLDLVSPYLLRLVFFDFIICVLKIGRISYYMFMLHSQPAICKSACMVVQLGYEDEVTAGSSRRADAFSCFSFSTRPLEGRLPFGDERADTATADMLKLLESGDKVLIKFQAMQVVYTEGVDEKGVKCWKQNFIGSPVSLFGTCGGVFESEGPLFSKERYDYLHQEIVKLMRPPRAPPV